MQLLIFVYLFLFCLFLIPFFVYSVKSFMFTMQSLHVSTVFFSPLSFPEQYQHFSHGASAPDGNFAFYPQKPSFTCIFSTK